MANTLRFKRGLASGIPTALAGEPLFTTDTFDLYIGNGTTNTRFQKYIASGATTQILRGDGSLYTFPLAISSPSNGQVLKYNGTSWVNDSDSGITGSGSAGQVAYFTGATTQAGSNNLFWDSTNARLGVGTNSPLHLVDVAAAGNSALYIRAGATSLSRLIFGTSTNNNRGFVDYDNSTNSLIVRANENESFRVFGSTRNVGINTGATDSGQRLQVVGTGYFSDSVGIGSTTLTAYNLRITKNITGANAAYGVSQTSTIQSDVTSSVDGFISALSTQAATFTLGVLRHFSAAKTTFGAGSTVNNQYGFFADSSLTGAVNNYGFFGNIASGSNQWNLYMNGTANNYLAGNILVGEPRVAGASWSRYAVVGNINFDKVILGYLASSTNGATIGANNGNLNAWARLNVAGSDILFRVAEVEHARLTSLGNFQVGAAADSGEKLQVTGTMKVTGATSIINDTNAAAGLSVLNPNTGTSAISRLRIGSANSNWSFDAVRIGGNLSIKNDISGSPVELLSITNGGNLAVDTNTLFVDATNNRVGIGTTTPSDTLHVVGNILATGGGAFEIMNSSLANVTFVRATGGGTNVMSTASWGNNIAIGTETAHDLILASNNTERMRLSSNGFLQHTNATNPTASVVDSYLQYSNDVTAGNAAPHFRTENGAVIKLYQETTAVGNAIFSQGGGNAVLDDSTFAGYTIRQVVQALRNQGILQ